MNTVGSSVSAAAQQPTLSDVIEQRLTQAEDIHEAAADLKLLLEDHPELNELVTGLSKIGVLHLYM